VKTVLVADDSRTTQMLLRTTLRRIPEVRFLAVDNGREALNVLGAEAVDLLVTDVNMPEMDGIALVREVRKTHAHLPIIIITAKGEEEARGEGLALGANAYVLKPIVSRELLELVGRLLEITPSTV
jgi:two-component system chemotaxis response regulator CheY